MSVVQDEAFGPVITVEKFTTEDQAVRLANDSIYGLSGGLLQMTQLKQNDAQLKCEWVLYG